jgi:hypothetical protein
MGLKQPEGNGDRRHIPIRSFIASATRDGDLHGCTIRRYAPDRIMTFISLALKGTGLSHTPVI